MWSSPVRAALLPALLASLLLPLASSRKVVSLEGRDWTLSNAALNISVPARLPSVAHLDLFANQVIGDPYFGLNDFNLRWITFHNWTYTSAPIAGLGSADDPATKTWLLFNGLDTFASISFCGRHVAATDNQFRQYWFDVTDHLRACPDPADRVLAIDFGSAPNIAAAIAAEPGAWTVPPGVQQIYEFLNRWFVRKEQSDFGWDWGPAFAPAGPWQPAWVVQLAARELHVRNSVVDIHRRGQINNLPPDQDQPWLLNAALDFFGELPAGATLRHELVDARNRTVSSGPLRDVKATDSTVQGMTVIPDGAVDLWWPSGMGPQTLYNLTLTLEAADGTPLASVPKRVGFRTIVLNELPISKEQLAQGIAPGNNWHFEINGHEFYAKGSNFIPPDAFWPRVTEARMERLFDSVIDGNQNMLRVWASGAYSPDFIYDLADEKGLLLWCEFQFGDALYPVNPAFLDNVRQEAEYQVRRVNHHPSLALWAGGNELESLELILLNESAPELLPKYTAQYEKLFIDTLGPAVFDNSRSITYSPSSTTNGWTRLNVTSPHPISERYWNVTPGSIYGDSDFYDYDPVVLYDDNAFPLGRFSNEFGFHSMPSVHSWRQQIAEEDLSFNSSVVLLRDHHFPPGGLNTSNVHNSSIGQAEMTEAVQMWYPVPNKTDPIANFTAWCWATQVYQADLYVSEIAFYRRGSGRPERQLGSLYWQLEDIWVAPTWSSLEYDGRWKVLHYAAKDIFSNVIIAPYYNITTGALSVWATSDLWEPVNGTATLDWMDWSGAPLTHISTPSTIPFTVGAINSTHLLSVPSTPALIHPQPPSDALLRLRVHATGSRPNTNTSVHFTHESWLHPTSLQAAKMQDPGLRLSHSNTSSTTTAPFFTVTATRAVAAWVWLDSPAGALVNFEANAFWLARGEERKVTYTVKMDETGGKWVEGVRVWSMWDQTTK